jgi:microsomal dipeptidase-like Zn-dependent dipeptidase
MMAFENAKGFAEEMDLVESFRLLGFHAVGVIH